MYFHICHIIPSEWLNYRHCWKPKFQLWNHWEKENQYKKRDIEREDDTGSPKWGRVEFRKQIISGPFIFIYGRPDICISAEVFIGWRERLTGQSHSSISSRTECGTCEVTYQCGFLSENGWSLNTYILHFTLDRLLATLTLLLLRLY